MVPDGVRVVSALHTVYAPPRCATSTHELDEDVLSCGDQPADKRARGRADRPRSRACAPSTAAGSSRRGSPSR